MTHQVDNWQNGTELAILVTGKMPIQKEWEVNDYLDELSLLVNTAGAEVVDRIIQERKKIDPAYFIGKGKALELAEKVKKLKLDLVVFDDDLTPAQVRNLENITEAKVIDRSGLILDIFARRAKSREAKTQVELAQLEYLRPRLTRRWSHLSRQEGGIGTRGPGETQLETDRRLIDKRISNLKADLKKISQQRGTRRQNRKELFKVALVGYTNTGKSTILNALTNAEVVTENRLFVTLDPTVRGFQIGSEIRILLIDTVGFIRKLPHNLVASFHSTLEETIFADLLLHIVDISHPLFEDQVQSVNHVLSELNISDKPTITVFNKIDLLKNKSNIDYLREKYEPAIFISATRGYLLSDLTVALREAYEKNILIKEIKVQSNTSNILNAISTLGTILDTNSCADGFYIKFKISKINDSKLETILKKYDEKVTEI